MEKTENDKLIVRYTLGRLIVMYLCAIVTFGYGVYMLFSEETTINNIGYCIIIILSGIFVFAITDVHLTLKGDVIKYRRMFKVKHINLSDIDIIEARTYQSSDDYSYHIEYVALDKHNKTMFSVDEYMKNVGTFVKLLQSKGVKVRILK